ncbi:MAG: prephenate dehydrogenase [Treponema sp.]|nr:prephenate dehydrogenase [Treponema sp.]
MKRLDELTYGIVGLGIMGGSFAKSIRQNVLNRSNSTGKIYVCNRSTACLSLAMQEGVADKTFTSDKVGQMLPECDVVFVCLYPHATVDFLKEHRDVFKSGAIVTDISGVKGIFIQEGDSLVRDDVDFIIGHPMAGGEKEGYAASNARYFINHNYILCPRKENREENVALFKNLIGEMGFTRITETDCDTHDWKIGFTSQLCHVIASAMVQSADGPDITAFGGGSFEDLTRIAMINAPLWTELFISNREKLVQHIENFEKALSVLKKDIAASDADDLKSYLEDVRAKRIAMACR